MPREPEVYDREWRQASKLVPADFKGLLAFRQFRLAPPEVYRHISPGMPFVGRPPKFDDDFTLRSIFNDYNWRPRNNVAYCHASKQLHPIPSRSCTCGFYGSYSSSIIYNPGHLTSKEYCFAAVRMYGEDLPLAQNGLRSSGADVAGVLFWPESHELPSVQDFMSRLSKEGIFYTSSAKAFIKQFPDMSYQDFLGFDPVQRLADLRLLTYEDRDKVKPWNVSKYSTKFCRPLRLEMINRISVPDEDTDRSLASEISLKPEYRPGGRLYVHPLREVWGE